MSDDTTPDNAAILVTGATGFIGRWLIAALTARGRRVAALVRGADARRAELASFIERIGGDASKLVVVEGDVERPGLGLSVALPAVRVVHHLAARFAFDLSKEDARRTNVDGTRHAVAFAAALPALDRFVFLGGYRMTAPSTGDDPYAHGAYEGSKHEAYRVFRELADANRLPWTAVHPSAVIGDSRTGETLQRVGLGDTIARLFDGRLPALAGSRSTFVPVVTVDALADVLATVSDRTETAGEELVVFDPASPNLPELVGIAARHLGVDAPSRTLPVGLVAALPRAWTGIHRESLGFLREDRYDTRAAERHRIAADLAHPHLPTAIARYADYLVSTRMLDAPDAAPGHVVEGTFTVGDPARADALLLHGIPFDGDAMTPLGEALAEASGLTHARVDLPGLGRSSPRGRIDDAWLEGVLAARTKPVVLVGHSLGARIATRFAARFPERVAALVLVAPTFLAGPAPLTVRLSPIVARVLARWDAPTLEARLLDGARAEVATAGALAALRRKGAPGRYARALARAASPVDRARALDDYRAARAAGVPTLVVHGAREAPIVDVAGASVVSIDGAGHNPHVTHTARVADAIRQFIATRAPRLTARGRRASASAHGESSPSPSPR